jgi:hypothetical protein
MSNLADSLARWKSSGGDTLAAYKDAAANTGASNAPSGVEGGLLLPVGAALASGSSSGSAAASSTPSSAANGLADNVKWAVGSAALLAWLLPQ